MNAIAVKKLHQRAAEILAEISGVVSQSNVTQFELNVLNSCVNQKLDWGSDKQRNIVAQIEVKVFGEVREAA